ncbi:MAG: ribbon-helix-helix protein, CopG family [Halobacteriaceae archaeon]
MPPQYDRDIQLSVICSQSTVRKIDRIADENELPREEVIRQLIDLGLDAVD